MTNTIQDRITREVERELDRHGTDEELSAYASKCLGERPVTQVWLEDHLKSCLICRVRLTMCDDGGAAKPKTPTATATDSAQVPDAWFRSGNVFVRSIAIEAGFLRDGAAFLHGVRATERSLHMGPASSAEAMSGSGGQDEVNIAVDQRAALQTDGELTLPNNQTVAIEVHALGGTPLQYEIRVSCSEAPHFFVSLSQPGPRTTRAPHSTQLPEVDLSNERVLHRAELGYGTKLRVAPGHWHLGFWSRTHGERWSVVQLILHGDVTSRGESESGGQQGRAQAGGG